KTNVGSTKKVHIEKIKALNPNIIIANKEENRLEVVESLQGICPVYVTDIITFQDTLKTIEDFGRLFKRTTDAKKWIEKIQFAKNGFEGSMTDKLWQEVAYLIWREQYMVAGNDTFITEMWRLNEQNNINADREGRYPEVEIRKMGI